MDKKAEGIKDTGILVVPFEPFNGDCLPINTECSIYADLGDRYRVGFPGMVGYTGTFAIKKSYIDKS